MKHKEIILEALNDYRGWFNAEDKESELDQSKIEAIDKAIEYIEEQEDEE